MSVTEAAKRLGVGRPALSNLLNAHSSLSPDMVVRLQKTFGGDPKKLLGLQAAFDGHARRSREESITAHAYVPHFLTIRARQIHDWADNKEARELLPVLLRKLIRSTGMDLRRLDFPGYDNAERKGWDGLLEAGAATPWIPNGKSCWEFSTRRDIGRKANGDYATRTRSVSAEERSECTFVFVTARNWQGKNAWESSKDSSGEWRAVRAFDASDLEQWLEESIPAQIWFAEKLEISGSGVETLCQFWERWSSASDPKITRTVFEPAIMAHRDTFEKWLKIQSEHPLVVTAESKNEAIAFLACLFKDSGIAPQWGDLPAVFKSAQDLRKLAASSALFIPIASTDEAARELAGMYRRLHCIVVCPRNAVSLKSDIKIKVDLLNHYTFVKSIESMGIAKDEAERLARESGCSPTILRRRLSKFDAIRTPDWARDERTARELIPMALIGTWHAQSRADGEVVEVLANTPHEEIEKSVARLLQVNDSPVWSAGEYRGVVSKMDALFAVNKHLIGKDLTEFFWLAEYVLSEIDPALDLPEDRRWKAGLYGKVRNHSSALRHGVCESLVILSVQGNNLFQDRIGLDVTACVGGLIRKLLTPLTIEKLLSHGDDLPHYAEAAPDEFLTLIEEDLQQLAPVTLGLLKPVDGGVFSRPQRSGLLWALECLAWKHIGRVSAILARLSRTVIDDNWANKPIASLEAIYRSWMPQTAASFEERVKALEVLTKRFPDIGWQVCIEQIKRGRRIGIYSYRPRWRSDASGAGQPARTWDAIIGFNRKMLELALAWPKHDQRTLGDLIETIQELPEEDQAIVWDRVVAWAASQADDIAKDGLRERIRRFAFTRIGQRRGLDDATRDRARRAYEDLQPGDLFVRHAWLFASPWVEFSSDDGDNGDIDYAKHMEKIDILRGTAMREIWTEYGFDGMKPLLCRGNAAQVVGHSLERILSGSKAQADFLASCLAITGDLEAQFAGCIEGFLRSVNDDERDALLSTVAEGVDAQRTARLFRCAPFGHNTWRLLDGYDKQVRDRYWQEVSPDLGHRSEAESIELIDRLLEVGRPRTAFHAAQFDFQRIETSRLKRLLHAVATVTTEPEEHYRLDAYRISEALNSLDGRPGVSPDEMVELEFMYIQALDRSEHGIPNLERQLAKSPATFFQALAFVCKRHDHGNDPPELRIEDPERRAGTALSCLRLLDEVSQIPGTGKDGKIDAEALSAWVMEVRRLCSQHDRTELGDQYIGKLLSNSPPEEDGMWPCRAVCEVMESLASQHMGTGFNIGVYNSRGVHERENGGGQERVLVQRYRGLARQRLADYPYVSRVLESIATTYEREAQHWDIEAEIGKRRDV